MDDVTPLLVDFTDVLSSLKANVSQSYFLTALNEAQTQHFTMVFPTSNSLHDKRFCETLLGNLYWFAKRELGHPEASINLELYIGPPHARLTVSIEKDEMIT
jgi:hypothetical protein